MTGAAHAVSVTLGVAKVYLLSGSMITATVLSRGCDFKLNFGFCARCTRWQYQRFKSWLKNLAPELMLRDSCGTGGIT